MPETVEIGRGDPCGRPPGWPALYEEEKARILAAISEYIDDIRHIGSTSVPGLGAKPIIDILVGLADLSLVEKCIQPLESLGCQYMGECGIPGRHYFRKPVGPLLSQRTHHVHVVENVGADLSRPLWRRQILFRDYLRLHPEDAQQYYLLKKELAARFGEDREGYTDAKTKFVQVILAKAFLAE